MIKFAKKSVIVVLSAMLVILPAHNGFCLSVGEEREVGEKLLYAVRSNFDLLDAPDLQQYIDSLGREVLDVAGVQYFDYHFFIIKNKEFNAFAAPSGLLFFHSGLIERVDSENELISVIAHEVGHIVKRHISSQVEKSTKIGLTTLALILASLALGGGVATEALFVGSIAAGKTASLHYSRMDEEEADLLAFDWMNKMQRDPQAQVEMLKTMRQIARYRSGMVPQYLLTHPNPENRMVYVESLVASQNEKRQFAQQNDHFQFLRFKYRVLNEIKDSIFLRNYYTSIMNHPRSTDTDKIMANYGLALLQGKENNFSQSLVLMDEVIDYFKDEKILLVDRGIIEYESGNLDQAYETFFKARNANREDMYATYNLAKVCFRIGKLDQAELYHKKVMYQLPEFSDVYFELGRLSSSKGNTGNMYYYLGKHYLLEGKLELSRKNLNAAIENDKTDKELVLDGKRSLDLIDRIEKE